jgi:hypothetical protein
MRCMLRLILPIRGAALLDRSQYPRDLGRQAVVLTPVLTHEAFGGNAY